MYKLRRAARQQLLDIFTHTIRSFGRPQAEKYRLEMIQAFELIAEYPTVGTDYSDLQVGLTRYTPNSHSIFYEKIDGGVAILFILHARQDPARYLGTEED